MSYARGTTNYNLPQTQGTDKRDWSDTNAAFLAVDSALKTANDTASSASSAATTAQTRANNAYTLASTANTTAGNAATAAATADEKAVTAKSRADSAYTLANTANTKTTALENVLKYQGAQPTTVVINCGAGETKTYTVVSDGWFQANFNLGGNSTNGLVWIDNLVIAGYQHLTGTAYNSFFAKAGTVIKATSTGATTIQVYRQ